jgi:membrane-associated two-gene conflict system component 1 (EACC1)
MADSFTLQLAADLEPSRFASLSRDLRSALSQNGAVEAAHAVRTPGEHERSAAIPVLQQLFVNFIGVGALGSVVQCLQAFVSRESSISYEITRQDGKKLKLEAKNFSPESIEQVAKTLTTFLS